MKRWLGRQIKRQQALANKKMKERDSRPEKGEGEEPRPLFALGQTLATPGALETLAKADQEPLGLLFRHVTGDWGDLPEEDIEENRLSVEKGFRVFSSYKLETGAKVWVITEWDRSATTILLPEEY